MSTIVLKVNPDLLSQMKDCYQSPASLPPGAIFKSKLAGVTVTGYHTGKLMFQGKKADMEAARWQDQATDSHASTNTPSSSNLPSGIATMSVLGSDEVGTGSYFGPLTTAAVYAASDQLTPLKEWGVQDSKQISDPEIIKIAKKICAKYPYHVLNLDPVDYNRLIKQYNQAQLKALCHNFVLGKVLKKISPQHPDAILIDQFVSPATYFNYLRGQGEVIHKDVYFHTKGEQYHLAVAAASIVARYYSLQSMDKLSEEAGMTLPIGAGNEVDQAAIKLLKRGESLDKFVKLHFANTKKIQKLLNQK